MNPRPYFLAASPNRVYGLRAMIRSSLAALQTLRRELGMKTTISVTWELLQRLRKGDPWSELEAPSSNRDTESRTQIGPAIVLYDVLNERFDTERAEEITKKVIQKGAVLFLKSVLPPIDKKHYQTLSLDEREEGLSALVDKFPNVTLGDLEATPDRFRFEVKKCAFVELTQSIGCPELAPLFCSGDAIYFEQYMSDIIFERSATLAKDNKPCDFCFRWSDRERN